MGSSWHSVAPVGGSGSSETDRAALRGLFDRLRDHVSQAEQRVDAALEDLTGVLVAAEDAPSLHARAEPVLAEQRSVAAGVARLAKQVGSVADAAEAQLLHNGDAERGALREVGVELQASAARLEARLADAEAEVHGAVRRLADRLDRWDEASAETDRRLADAINAGLGAAEERQAEQIARLVAAVERKSEAAASAPPAISVPTSEDEPHAGATALQRRGSRSAALLLSAGVACLGLTTLAVLLEPPFPVGEPAGTAAHAEIVLRGPIIVAPPRYAEAEELVAPPATDLGSAPDAQKQLAAAISGAEAGRPGAVARLRGLAEAGMPRAQMYLAKLYESGRGVAADPAEARRWTAQAADAGDPVAMHNLALYYLQGRGGPRDDAMAARLFKRSASAGVADSQFNLGLLYETGAGVDRNLVEAYRWFQVAAIAGDLKARERAVSLEVKLSEREVARGERMASSFRPGAGELQETILAPGAATIAESQKKLARLGLYIGPTDGQDSAAYRQAVEAYRRSRAADGPTLAAVGAN